MASVADYLVPRGAPEKVFVWFGYHLAVYAGIAVAVAFLFLAGAGVYSYIVPADVISIETQPSPVPGGDVPAATPVNRPHPFPLEDLLVAGLTNPFATGNLIGLDVLDGDKKLVGTITDLVLDRHGNAQGVVVGLSGYWLTKKYVVIPFTEFTWDYEPSAANPKMLVIERGTVSYKREHLQNLPPVGDPRLPVSSDKAGSE